MKKRVIDDLRKAFPGKWKYSSEEGKWKGPDFDVQACAKLAPQHDHDDDTFETVYIRSDTREEVRLGWPFLGRSR